MDLGLSINVVVLTLVMLGAARLARSGRDRVGTVAALAAASIAAAVPLVMAILGRLVGGRDLSGAWSWPVVFVLALGYGGFLVRSSRATTQHEAVAVDA